MLDNAIDRKLDGHLIGLLNSNFARHAKFPIIVRAAPSKLDHVVSLVGRRGQVRHVLWQINAVSAWLTLDSIQEIAQLDSVSELELSQKMRIAQA